jgi:acetyltransferase-like isoleucine patch superfamily enzyme
MGEESSANAQGGTTALWQKIAFRLRYLMPILNVAGLLRLLWFRLLGAKIGMGTQIPPGIWANWPHQMELGDNCVLENDLTFKFADSWKPGVAIRIGNRVFLGRGCEFNCTGSITIGDDCLIAAGTRFVDHDHGIALGQPMNQQQSPMAPILVGEDVWIGANVVVLKGVTIGSGAVIGAGAIVTKSVPPNEIWAGVPARKIGERT